MIRNSGNLRILNVHFLVLSYGQFRFPIGIKTCLTTIHEPIHILIGSILRRELIRYLQDFRTLDRMNEMTEHKILYSKDRLYGIEESVLS